MTMMRLMLLLPLLAAAPYFYYGVVSFSPYPSQPSPAQYNDRNRRWLLRSRETNNRLRPPPTTPLLLLWQQNNDEADEDDERKSISDLRRKLFLLPIAAVGAYGYGNLLAKALSVRGIEYPSSHESRVASTIATAIITAAAAAESMSIITTTTASSSSDAYYAAATATAANNKSRRHRPSSLLRVLEVGIGTEARLLRRGLYDPALQQLAAAVANNSNGVGTCTKKLELTGVDVRIPDSKNTAASVVQREVNQKLSQLQDRTGIDTDLLWVEGSITDGLPQYSDGYFDCIVCCLTLCSVEAPVTAALQEMKRLLRVDGGTLGYVEHVAVEPDDQQHRFLEWQQTTLDPWQQKLADNCHLHRYTERDIQEVFVVSNNDDDTNNSGSSSSSTGKYLQQERFYVDSMWPVSCQCCGVVQRSRI